MACDISPDIPKPSIPPLQRRTNRPPFIPVAAISAEANIYLIGGSIPELEPTTKEYYNISLVFPPDGVLIGTHLKTPLFSIDIPGKLKFKESNVLSSDNELTVIDRPEYRKIGLAICYDIHFPESAKISARKFAFLLVYRGAFNITTGPRH